MEETFGRKIKRKPQGKMRGCDWNFRVPKVLQKLQRW
jgi:hypothetical protein